jgi:hypothetical protein
MARGKPPALLARALTHCDEVPLEGALARATGLLCGRAGTTDIVDASVALVAAARSPTIPTALVTSTRPRVVPAPPSSMATARTE